MAGAKANLKHMLTTLFFILVLVYFCYHAMDRDRGLFALVQLNKELEQAQLELDVTRAERIKLSYHTKLLKAESLDLDLLDEQARKILGYSAPEEKIYLVLE